MGGFLVDWFDVSREYELGGVYYSQDLRPLKRQQNGLQVSFWFFQIIFKKLQEEKNLPKTWPIFIQINSFPLELQ